jgi:hypothetical protein
MTAIGDATGQTVVDVGCGNDRYLLAFQLAGASAVGMALSTGVLVPIAGTRTLVVADTDTLVRAAPATGGAGSAWRTDRGLRTLGRRRGQSPSVL